jgi:peptidoglycan hydrolase CwlO-like protein
MPVQGDFWILVLIGLLIANLAVLFYVKLDFDKKVGGLSQEVKGVRENLLYVKQGFDERIVELLQEVIDIFDKRIIGLLQEINGIKANDIREMKEKIEKLSSEMKQLEQQTKERIDHIAKLLTEPILDESELKI